MDKTLVFILCLWGFAAASGNAGCRKMYTSPAGEVKSPANEERQYPNNTCCVYTIKTPAGNSVILHFSVFDIMGTMPGCTEDYLEVFVGCERKSIGKFCSENSVKPQELLSPDHCLELHFHSDKSGTGRGFKAIFWSHGQYRPVRTDPWNYKPITLLNSSSQIIFSPRWPLRYPSNVTKLWRISTARRGLGVKLYLMDFKTRVNSSTSKPCNPSTDDILTIQAFTGGSPVHDQKQTLCGDIAPRHLSYSEVEKVIVRFYANGDKFTDRGFVLGYVTFQPVTSSSAEDSSGTFRLIGLFFGLVMAFFMVPA